MVSRAAHYRSKSKHAQRGFGEVKPSLPARDTDTLWLVPFIESAQGCGPFNADSIIARQLGDDHDERVTKLRRASKMGVLQMTAHRDDSGAFVEYRWHLSAEATR